MSRILGLALATALTGAAVTGAGALIAYDFLGEERMLSLVASAASSVQSMLSAQNQTFQPGKEITFFEQVPIEGSDLAVWTGAGYASVPAIEQRRPSKQWCYINVSSGKPGIQGRLDLGSQYGEGAATYTDLDQFASVTLASHGLSPDAVADLARTHCRFGLIDPFAKG